MKLSVCWNRSLVLLLTLPLAPAVSWAAAASVDTATIAKTIKSDVAQLVAGLNAHDADKTTAFDSPNVVSMECGSPSTVGLEADRDASATALPTTPFGKLVSSTRP